MALKTKTGLFNMESFHTKTPVSSMAAGFCACGCACGCGCATCLSNCFTDPNTGTVTCELETGKCGCACHCANGS